MKLPTTLSLNQLTALTSMAYRTVKRRLDGAGVEPITDDAKGMRYAPPDALQAIYCYTGQDGLLDLTQERAKLAHLQGRRIELQLLIDQGKAVLIEDVTREVGLEYAAIRVLYLGLGHKISPQLVGLKTAEICSVLDSETRSILQNLCADAEFRLAADPVAAPGEVTGHA